MNMLTTTAHLRPDTEVVIRVFDGTGHASAAPFVSLRIGNGDVDVVFLADLGTAPALRTLAMAAEKAATVLDELAGRIPEGAA
ncbi:hypothetical protein GCM10011579_059920 [Streptomyces albiflavescens]|uniref:Uncharacterized protein n=1 Tax=Streptomyces albiflavescens TaxID=1623582 RepID=A0A917Y928_9ACTN|nr:hypothetical protein [Streptomyces albiflavescens]GGN77556.1 hypothetical protein GCM10011579_059920 [Streptomyces albiflavescens]